MKSKLLNEISGQRTFAVVLDPGEEAMQTLADFALKEGIAAASITAIGAFESATVGWFDFPSKTYRRIPVNEQCEVLSAIGDIAVSDDGKPGLHLHAVLGLSDGRTRGGHLMTASFGRRWKRSSLRRQAICAVPNAKNLALPSSIWVSELETGPFLAPFSPGSYCQ